MGKVNDSFYDALLADLHATINRNVALTFFHAWQIAEGGSATYNPFNTKQPEPGSTDYNSVHVKNYPNEATGIKGTFDTMIGGPQNENDSSKWTNPKDNRYAFLLQSLGANGLDATDSTANLAHDVGASGWGTSESTLLAVLKVQPTNQNFGNPNDPSQAGIAEPQGITGGLATGAAKSATGAAKSLLSWTESLGNLLSNLLDPKFWLRIGQGLASVALLLIGLGLMFRKDATALIAGKVGAE